MRILHTMLRVGDLDRSIKFYTEVLGLRLVKKSVNQDDVSAYHLFYADKLGSPGTDMTFFDWPQVIADRRGVFVQPALFEAFGLTVIEAMSSGLPTFATCYGGPLEIIEPGLSGFHIDPNHGGDAADLMAGFFERCAAEPEHWEAISAGGVDRVMSRYTWKLYAERMMTLARIYGFWKYITNLDHAETRRYLEMFYALQFRPRAQSLLD